MGFRFYLPFINFPYLTNLILSKKTNQLTLSPWLCGLVASKHVAVNPL
jgi:hypothetical protein